MAESSTPPPRFPAWLKVALLAGVTALASVGYLSARFNGSTRERAEVSAEAEDTALRTPVDDFILTDGSGGQKKLSDYRGNVVILAFWASWCGPCLSELPTFAEMERRFAAEGLKILAVNVEEDAEIARSFSTQFWKNKNIGFSNFFDTKQELAQKFKIDMLPSTFVIDREGRLVLSSFGANDWSVPETLEFIESLLKEPQS